MAINNKLSKPGLLPIKIENQDNLITTQVNKINFTGSGVTASVGQFNDLTILITGGGGSGISSSYALSASYADTASYFSGSISNAISSSYALSSSFALTASYFSGSISDAISSSYALSASNSFTSSYAFSASYWSGSTLNAVSASFAETASTASYWSGSTLNAVSASYALSASYAAISTNAYTASYWSGSILNAVSSSYALTASYLEGYVDPFPYSGSAQITGSLGVTGSLSIYKSGSTVLNVEGSSGQLFSITDSLTGSLFSVNTVAGLPVMEAFSDNTVNIGKFGVYPIKVAATGTLAQITGSITGSLTGSLLGTASFATTASWALNSRLLNGTASSVFATTGSNNFKGDQNISGSLDITGSLTLTGASVDVNLTATNIVLNATTLRAPLLPVSSPPGGALLNTVLIDQLNGTLYVTSSLPGGGGGSGLADRIQTGSITASVSDGTGLQPWFFLLQSGSREMLKFNTEGVMQLEAYTTTPTPITGGIYYSASGEFFFGI